VSRLAVVALVLALLVGCDEESGNDGWQDTPLRPDLAVGDADAILERIWEYRRAGASKFVLRPVAADARDVERQTRLLIERVIPAAHD